MRLVWTVLVAGCSFSEGASSATPPADAPTDSPQLDAAHVFMDAAPPADMCFGTEPFYFCLNQLPTTPLTYGSNTTIDTDMCSGGILANLGTNQTVCVLSGTTVTVTSTVTVSGKEPLVFASTGAIEISGTLDVSSSGDNEGPNADPSVCSTSGMDGSSSGNGGGGGAGGSFGNNGGNGGKGGNGGNGGNVASGGALELRGGCRGGAGGSGASFIYDNGGGHGAGGGAVFVVAGTVSAPNSLTIGGTINASGSGGGGGYQGYQSQIGNAAGGGGGGGGSGGMILLSALTLTVTGNLVADGGGGGGGADTQTAGKAGNNPNSNNPSSTANGGNGAGSSGGSGGHGSVTSNAASNGGNGNGNGGGGAGGGGGGGVGVIKVLSGGVPASSNKISPPATN